MSIVIGRSIFVRKNTRTEKITNMKVGSLVETVTCFEHLRLTWGFNYPKKGEILRVRDIQPHLNKDVRDKGIVFLYFEEYPDLVGVCDKKVSGETNFLEILPLELSNVKENFKLIVLEKNDIEV